MLNDDIIDKVNERLIKRIEEGNEYIIDIIGKNIKRLRNVSPSDANRLINILKYGGDYDKIVNKLKKITKMNKKDIIKIFNEVAKVDTNFAKQFYDYRKIKYIPYEKNIPLKTMVNSIANTTANEYINLTRTSSIGLGIIDNNNNLVIKPLKQAYTDIMDRALINISQGKETFYDVMRRQLKELGPGMRVIYPTTYVDKNGEVRHHSKRLDSATRQLINDGLSEMHTQMQEELGKQFGANGVEITVLSNPAPDHEEVQGRQFSDKEFFNFQNDKRAKDVKGKVFEANFGKYDRRSIGQYNCRHKIYKIIVGVNTPHYTDKQLQKIIDDNHKGFDYEGKHYSMYEGSQLQRQIETAIRDNKNNQIIARASDDKELIRESQSKITILRNKYKELVKASGLPDYKERMTVSGYRRVKT